MRLALPLPLLLACGRTPDPVPTDADNTADSDTDTEAPWVRPPEGRFEFETEFTWAPGEPWTVEAHYFPASKPERPAVLIYPRRTSLKRDDCGIDDWPEGLVEPFAERDWAVIITDRIGCRTTHAWYAQPELNDLVDDDDLGLPGK